MKLVHEFAFPANGGRVFMHLTDIQTSFVVRTVVPATSGHFRFGAKVAPRGRWPLVAGGPSWQGTEIHDIKSKT